MATEVISTFLVDGISAIAVHNGIARLQFMHLGCDGKPEVNVEIQIPVVLVKTLADSLRKIS